MLVNCNENYIAVFTTNFSYRYNVLLTELQDLGHNARTGIQDQGCPWATRMHCGHGISLISTSSTKPLESGKRDFKLAWLQEEDSW